MFDNSTVARAGFATAEPIALPASSAGNNFDIQWMPPGAQSPTCFVQDKPRTLKFTVKPQHAQALNAQLQQLLAKAATGNGDLPFIDFNHEDGRAAGRPLEIYWAGEDPKSGGIRLKGTWTASGKSAVQGGDFTRFSPEWLFSDATQEPIAITVNLGGLVNRAAFTGIQPVQARAKEAFAGDHDFVREVAAMNLSQKMSHDDAMIAVAQKKPALYKSYMQHCDAVQRKAEKDARARAKACREAITSIPDDEFMTQAKAIAADRNISTGEAAIILARANFPLYQKHVVQQGQAVRTAQAMAAHGC